MRLTPNKHRRLWLLGIASVVAEPLAMKLRGYPMGGKLGSSAADKATYSRPSGSPAYRSNPYGSAGGATSGVLSAGTGR